MYTLLFLNLGGGEVAVIVLVIILFFGSKSIPDIARGLGRGIREFKDATSGIQREIQDSINTLEKEEEQKKEEKPVLPATPDSVPRQINSPE